MIALQETIKERVYHIKNMPDCYSFAARRGVLPRAPAGTQRVLIAFLLVFDLMKA
jgi:hypothetical protein